MKILLDHCVPRPFKNELPKHEVSTAKEMRWESLTNGELLREAEANGFEVLVTVDQNLRYQQNLVGSKISVCILVAQGITVEDLRPLVTPLEDQLTTARPGKLYEVRA